MGDDYQNRLLLYLREQIPFIIEDILRIRNHVFLIKTDHLPFILKGFPTYHRLKLQESFTESLKKEGFHNTYHFLSIEMDPPLLFEQKYYGCLEYIEPAKESFSYHQEENRHRGLKVLKDYHQTTRKLVRRYKTLIPDFDLKNKWQERYRTFVQNLPIIRFFIKKEFVRQILAWAHWSLNGLEREKSFFHQGETVILHGDVAHHNFIFTEQHQLTLIDFDLIAIGKNWIDYLQYANRIFPFLEWNLQELWRYEEMKEYQNVKGFLYALAFPTDIMREWNRVIKEKSYNHPRKIRPIMELTMEQFHLRKQFFKDLQSTLDDN